VNPLSDNRADKGALYDERLEQSLRTAGAAIHEGKTFDVTGLANTCIEVADYLARVRPLPVVEVFQCWWCNQKRIRVSDGDKLKAPHSLVYTEELCTREGCDPIKGTYPWTPPKKPRRKAP
jgi:hypothetical protein